MCAGDVLVLFPVLYGSEVGFVFHVIFGGPPVLVCHAEGGWHGEGLTPIKVALNVMTCHGIYKLGLEGNPV